MEYQNGSLIKPRGTDFLKIRFQRMVKAMLAEEHRKVWSFATDQHQPILSRILWICVLLTCIALFCFQTYDRTLYYFTYPVSVNGFIRKRNLQTFPHLTICYQETKGFFEISRNIPKSWRCYNNIIMNAIQAPGKLTMDEVWEKMNTSTAVISAKGIYQESMTTLHTSNKYMMFGICTTFFYRSNMPLPVDGGKYEIVLGRYSGKCESKSSINMYLHDETRILTTHRRRELQLGKKHELGVTIREVHFINRHQSPCLSPEEAQECEKNCFTSYLMKNVKCRFPFFPDNVNLNPCNMSYNTLGNWLNAHWYLTGAYAEKPPCSCTRKCQYRAINEKHSYSMEYNNQSIITMSIDDPYDILIQEEYSYSIIDLLSTIGGNSGLYLGASVLSIAQLITAGVSVKKRKKPKFTHDDPLYQKVLKTFKVLNLSGNKITYVTPVNPISKAAFKLTAVVVCVFWLFTVFNRIIYYLEYPSKIFVDIAFNVTLQLPSLTICTGDPNVIQLQKLIAQEKNLSDFCDVNVWELFALPRSNIASIIWENQSLDPLQEINNEKKVAIFDGTCVEFRTLWYTVPSVYVRWFYEEKPFGKYNLCGKNHMKVYIRGKSGRLDHLQYRYYISGTMTQITLVIKEIRLDDSTESCVSEKVNEGCMDNCRKRKLLERITCRLPYMPASKNLSLCNSAHSAKQSHLTYMEIYLIPPSLLNCNCLPKCVTQIYETQASSEVFRISVLVFNAAHNVVESYKKIRTYPFIQLLCDIGGLLGSLLGSRYRAVIRVIAEGDTFPEIQNELNSFHPSILVTDEMANNEGGIPYLDVAVALNNGCVTCQHFLNLHRQTVRSVIPLTIQKAFD